MLIQRIKTKASPPLPSAFRSPVRNKSPHCGCFVGNLPPHQKAVQAHMKAPQEVSRICCPDSPQGALPGSTGTFSECAQLQRCRRGSQRWSVDAGWNSWRCFALKKTRRAGLCISISEGQGRGDRGDTGALAQVAGLLGWAGLNPIRRQEPKTLGKAPGFCNSHFQIIWGQCKPYSLVSVRWNPDSLKSYFLTILGGAWPSSALQRNW